MKASLKIKDLPLFVWIKLAIVSVIFILWVIWIGNYWLLFIYPLIFDSYTIKIIPWGGWKRTKFAKKHKKVVEWIDALFFALVAVYLINIFLFQNYKIPTSSLEKTLLVGDHLFVSKVSYGPRMPNTPLAFPLVQNIFPIINTKSYFDWPHWDYNRLSGFGNVENNDIVVFNFPAGDTVCLKVTNPDYNNIILNNAFDFIGMMRPTVPAKYATSEWSKNQYLKERGREIVKQKEDLFGEVIYRPVDRRDNYVKRCIATPGDVLEIKHNQVFINGEKADDPKNLQHIYQIITDGTILNDRFFEKLEVSNDDKRSGSMPPYYSLPLTEKQLQQLKSYSFIKNIVIQESPNDSTGNSVFPYSADYPWSRDNFGPLEMPKQGKTIELNIKNLVLYDRIITAYENNTLTVKGDEIFINGEKADSYTFKMNYYFMLGDNRHKSADSRYWGFVPEDHIVGRPIVVWLSLNKDKSLLKSIRWNRFFKIVDKK